jgi:hypothetical protein
MRQEPKNKRNDTSDVIHSEQFFPAFKYMVL